MYIYIHTHRYIYIYIYYVYIYIYIYIWLRPGGPPSPPPPASISNGRHGVFSPHPPVEQDIPLLLPHPLPPPPRFCALLPAASPPPTPAALWFSNCACGPGKKENPAPPPWNRMVFPFAIYTHIHTLCLCECMAILSPNPPSVEGFPFWSETDRQTDTHTHTNRHTHTHTPRVCVCMAFSLRTRSSAKPAFHSLVCAPSGVRYGVRHACRGGPPGLEASGPCIWGGYHWGGGGGEGGPRTHSAQPYGWYPSPPGSTLLCSVTMCVCVCANVQRAGLFSHLKLSGA